MKNLKDGIRAHVRLDWNGRVHKRFRGTDADQRYATEVAVLKVLEERGCPYVPKLLEEYPEELYFVSTNCGQPANTISKDRADQLFADLERDFGLVGGDIFHGKLTLDQLFSARPMLGHADYRGPLKGLYMCGAGTHPGGGVTGAPGHNAARAVLADVKARK